jgi:hypothetical protein
MELGRLFYAIPQNAIGVFTVFSIIFLANLKIVSASENDALVHEYL